MYTGNIVNWSPLEQGEQPFDRIISIEMLEHMKNYKTLFQRVATWLNKAGLFFVHVFVHKENPFHFEVHSSRDWMAKYFFSVSLTNTLSSSNKVFLETVFKSFILFIKSSSN